MYLRPYLKNVFNVVYFLSFQLGIMPEDTCILQGLQKAGDKGGRDREEMEREIQTLAPREGEGHGKPNLIRHTQVKTTSIPTGV